MDLKKVLIAAVIVLAAPLLSDPWVLAEAVVAAVIVELAREFLRGPFKQLSGSVGRFRDGCRNGRFNIGRRSVLTAAAFALVVLVVAGPPCWGAVPEVTAKVTTRCDLLVQFGTVPGPLFVLVDLYQPGASHHWTPVKLSSKGRLLIDLLKAGLERGIVVVRVSASRLPRFNARNVITISAHVTESDQRLACASANPS